MKKIFTLLALLISLGLTPDIIASNNQVVAKSTGCTSIDGKGVVTFVVTSPQVQVCDLSFLMMPGEYEDGSFTSVTIKVNGVTLPEPITFNTYGWQPANTTGNVVTLNEGDNTVQFISSRDDVPMVREVKVSDGIRRTFPMQSLSASSLVARNENNKENVGSSRYIDNEGNMYIRPSGLLYRPGVYTNKNYYYTTSIDIYYENGDNYINLYAPTSWDPVFGRYESTVDYNAYVFYKSDPSVYSKKFSTHNHYFNYQERLPISGEYCMIIEPMNANEEGWVSVRINSTLYRSCYVSQDSLIEVKKGDIENDVIVSTQDSYYNMFTIDNNDMPTNHIPDPVLWLKEQVIIGVDTSDIIIAYSDSNMVCSEFQWGKNARIRTKLDSSKQYFLRLSSALPYVLKENPDFCDLYHSYWNSADSILNHNLHKGNVIYEDFIESDRTNNPYNCYAWAAGIIYSYIEPTEDWKVFFDDLFLNKSVKTKLDYRVKRPHCSPVYTRDGATFENAVVDLWGDITENNDTIINHASVRNPYSGIPNGYDWESKLGINDRVFHPRLADLGYGEIVCHYTFAPGQENVEYSYEGIVYKAVASGELIIEDTQLTYDEKSRLSQNVLRTSTYGVDRFEQYYNQWKEYAKTKFHYSNSEYYKDSIAYPQLVNYILSNIGEEYKAYKKFDEGDYFAAVLIKDISSVEGTRAKKVWDEVMNVPLDGNIIRTSWGNVRLFIKTMLQDEKIDTIPQTGKIRSNEDDVEIIGINGGVSITVGLDKTTKYSINAVNVQTSQQLVLLPESSHQVGEETYQYSLSPGAYIIVVIIDGNINAQKVIVK